MSAKENAALVQPQVRTPLIAQLFVEIAAHYFKARELFYIFLWHIRSHKSTRLTGCPSNSALCAIMKPDGPQEHRAVEQLAAL